MQERSVIRVVHHGHAAEVVGQHFDECLDVFWYCDGRIVTEIELFGDVIIGRVDVLGLDQVIEALLVPCDAFLTVQLSSGLISDGVIGMRIEVLCTHEPENWGAGRDGSVESRWVLHSEPRCEHTTV